MNARARITPQQAEAVHKATLQAGAIITDYLRSEDRLNVCLKPDGSRVTAADFAADAHLKEALHRITPGIPVLSEEDDLTTQRQAAADGTYWCIDPLDGTHTAIARAQGNQSRVTFGPLVGLVQHGKPVFGVAHYPVLHENGQTYFTSHDGAASFRQQGEENAVRLALKKPLSYGPLRLSQGWRTMQAERLHGRSVTPVTGEGSRLMHVADGRADLAFLQHAGHPPGFWDLAALEAVLRGAGGHVVSIPPGLLETTTTPEILRARPLRYMLNEPEAKPYHSHCLAGTAEALQQVGVPVHQFIGVWRDRF